MTTIAPIDAVGLALLRALLADVEAGRAVFTVCNVRDDATGQSAELAWAPPPSPSPSPSPSPPPSPPAPGGRHCPTCEKAADVVGDAGDGGFYCATCDISFE